MTVSEAVDAFRAELGKCPAIWDRLRFTALAARHEGSWRLLGLDCMLTPTAGEEADFFLGDDLIIVSRNASANQLDGLLNGLNQDFVRLRHDLVADTQGYNNWNCYKEPGGGSGLAPNVNYPYVLLRGTGSAVREVADENAIHSQARLWGYRGLNELSAQYLGFSVGDGYNCQIRVVVPLYLEARAEFRKDTLHVVVSCHPGLKKDVFASCNVRLSNGGLTSPHRIQEWHENGASKGFIELSQDISLPADAESATIWVFHRSRREPMWSFHLGRKPTTSGVANPLWAAFKATAKRSDPQEKLREFLGLAFLRRQRDKNRFEEAAVNLLTLCGWRCLSLGGKWQWEGVDFIALAPDDQTLIVGSATIEAQKVADHLRKLIPQVNSVRQAVEGLTICPALVVPAKADDLIQSDLESCQRENVALVLLPDLEALLEAAVSGFSEQANAALRKILGL